ncbi:hypothetical protein DMENIID0001_104430 [Sergentomyia squamirostris]
MKCLLGVVLCVSLVLLHILPKVCGQDEAEISAARANCDVTYVCCKLKVKRRFRRLRRFSWIRRARCIRWCPQETTCIETPTPFQAYDIDEAEEDPTPNEYLHGESEDPAQAPIPAEGEAEGTEDTQVDADEGTASEDTDPDDEVIDIPVDEPLPVGIMTASVIKVPCNGNFKPDRHGVCRAVFS